MKFYEKFAKGVGVRLRGMEAVSKCKNTHIQCFKNWQNGRIIKASIHKDKSHAHQY